MSQRHVEHWHDHQLSRSLSGLVFCSCFDIRHSWRSTLFPFKWGSGFPWSPSCCRWPSVWGSIFWVHIILLVNRVPFVILSVKVIMESAHCAVTNIVLRTRGFLHSRSGPLINLSSRVRWVCFTVLGSNWQPGLWSSAGRCNDCKFRLSTQRIWPFQVRHRSCSPLIKPPLHDPDYQCCLLSERSCVIGPEMSCTCMVSCRTDTLDTVCPSLPSIGALSLKVIYTKRAKE